ncbi:hypothetical protein OBBRIDRAFT_741960 [Obba rivulosa]|uniref:BTB domain-containing protein n=1 Tax=Obba rivulosa TaxID=1052685 RepID=A0A8E2AGT5_9APHY|nr:hypothetical protein OBBRIDRAFT_741960 [Obba rivulosa]
MGSRPTSLDFVPALPPFNKRTADIIFITSDNVAFRVHSQLLSLASRIFEGMFDLPQPVLDGSDGQAGAIFSTQVLHDGLPLIPVSERSDVLETLLRFLYPVPDPTLASVKELDPVLKAALKYDMLEAIDILKERLRGFIKTALLEVYCIACCYGFEEQAAIAAAHIRSRDLQYSYVPQLRQTTAGCYFRLLQYCKTPSKQSSFCHPPSDSSDRVADSSAVLDANPLFDNIQADTILRTFNNVDFLVHSMVLTQTSTVFRDMFSIPQPERKTDDEQSHDFEDARPIVRITETSIVMDSCTFVTIENP